MSCQCAVPKDEPKREDTRDALLIAMANHQIHPTVPNATVLYRAIAEMEQFA